MIGANKSGSLKASRIGMRGRDLIAQLVFDVLVAVEVERGLRPGGGHHIPGGAAAADVVDRGEDAGDV